MTLAAAMHRPFINGYSSMQGKAFRPCFHSKWFRFSFLVFNDPIQLKAVFRKKVEMEGLIKIKQQSG